jgi:hypothetical protein
MDRGPVQLQCAYVYQDGHRCTLAGAVFDPQGWCCWCENHAPPPPPE